MALTTTSTNAYAKKGRLLKASVLANLLWAHGYRAAQVEQQFGEDQWFLVASTLKAKKKTTSAETRALTIQLLREREGAVIEMRKREEVHGTN